MKFALKLKGNLYNFMRERGYHPDRWNEKPGQLVFIRRLGSDDYPRFHIYARINNVSRETIVNLHLDQKKPIYKGVKAHSGEYEGELVKKEAERIKKIAG